MTTRQLSIEDFAEALEGLPEKFEHAAVRGLRSAARMLEGFAVEEITTAKPYPAVATGELSRSVVTTDFDDGAVVEVESPHGVYMEEGTRPHRPPLAPLMDWVRVKGFARDEAAVKRIAWAVAEKIARDGIAPRHFLKKAVARLESGQHVAREITRELNRIDP